MPQESPFSVPTIEVGAPLSTSTTDGPNPRDGSVAQAQKKPAPVSFFPTDTPYSTLLPFEDTLKSPAEGGGFRRPSFPAGRFSQQTHQVSAGQRAPHNPDRPPAPTPRPPGRSFERLALYVAAVTSPPSPPDLRFLLLSCSKQTLVDQKLVRDVVMYFAIAPTEHMYTREKGPCVAFFSSFLPLSLSPSIRRPPDRPAPPQDDKSR